MRALLRKAAFPAVCIIIISSIIVYAHASGITGVTTSGCTCHGSKTAVVSISGPDTLAPGATGSYTITIINQTSMKYGGIDLKASAGTLTPGTGLKKSGSELTHSAPLLVSGSAYTWQFSFTAPATPATVTFNAAGAIGASTSTTSGPWGFAAPKTILVMAASSPSFSVKLVPQGFYNHSDGRLRMKDSVKLYLANTASPYAVVDSAKAVLDSVTFKCSPQFAHAASGSYYLVAKHRNSIETWSNQAVAFSATGSSTYNFTDSANRAYGANQIKIDSLWCIYSGDVSQDGIVDISDMVLIDNDSYAFASGYVASDVNGDGSVDISDMVLVDNNSYNFVGKHTPAAGKRPSQFSGAEAPGNRR